MSVLQDIKEKVIQNEIEEVGSKASLKINILLRTGLLLIPKEEIF